MDNGPGSNLAEQVARSCQAQASPLHQL